MNNKRLFIDINAIQTLPPSNINRDDTGSPKTAQYGGVIRARVSSQSWKKAMRDYFYNNSEFENIGVRTLEIVKYLAEEIKRLKPSLTDEDALNLANETFKAAGIGTKDNKAKALFFLGKSQRDALAQAAIDGEKDKKKLQEILSSNPAIDIALFGRMVADDQNLNEDASAQVAHAISTHQVSNEYDFFTAVDDISKEESQGAGMLGTVEYNSSTLYRYANVAAHELLNQLGSVEDAVGAIRLFVEAFAKSLPTGKVNTFANQTLPQSILLTIRDDRPVNLVSAFEEPVRSNDGYVEKSIKKLLKEEEKVLKFVNKPLHTYYITMADMEEKIEGEYDTFEELLNEFSKDLEANLKDR